MKDLAVNVDTGDILISAGDMQLVDNLDAVEQRIRTRLRFLAGEWFLDTRVGVPYFDDILVKNPNFPDVENILKVEILETEGVEELLSFDSSFDNAARFLSVTCNIRTVHGVLEFNDTIFV